MCKYAYRGIFHDQTSKGPLKLFRTREMSSQENLMLLLLTAAGTRQQRPLQEGVD